MNEWSFLCKMAEPWWQGSRRLPSSSWVRMNEFESHWTSYRQSFVQNSWIQDGRIQDGRIQDGCHHHVKWEWKSLSQIELVWVRVRMEWEYFWVNLREENKVFESKMAVSDQTWQNSRWLPSSSWFRMNEWSFSCANGGNQSWQVWMSLRGKPKMAESKMAKFKLAEFKMAIIIKLSENEWVWVRLN